MTVNEMLTLMGYHLDDPDGERFTTPIKLAALNAQQGEIVAVVSSGLVPALQKISIFTGIADGNNLPGDYFRYVASYLRAVQPERWITKLEMETVSQVEDNQYSKGSDDNPICFVWEGKYYLRLTVSSYGTDAAKVRLFYLIEPATLAAGGVCELHPALHKGLIILAEAELRAIYNFGSLEDTAKLRETGWGEIAQIEARYKAGELRI